MKPVTGPDGDNPITDEQIRELRDAPGTALTVRASCHTALNPSASEDVRRQARARCAGAMNGGRPITDTEIRLLCRLAARSGDIDTVAACALALDPLADPDGMARANCAAAWNARYGPR